MSDKAITYISYLKVDELLELQQPESDGEHDEMLFIIIHQTYELWFKQLIHEFQEAQCAMEAGDSHYSLAILGRIRTILKVCVTQIDILETMTPLQFNAFRSYLSSSSGFQSAQFRMVEALLGRRDSRMAGHLPPDIQEQIKSITSRNSVWDSAIAYIDKRGHKMPTEVLNRDKSAPYNANEKVQEVLLEVHLFDCADDLYGEYLEVQFLHRLREEVHFTSMDALVEQIYLDIQAAKNYFAMQTGPNELINE